MAYLANHGYKNDVFVSYAHADNAPRLESKIQWVSDLVVELQTVLSQKLKNKEGQKPHIWIDHELAKNIPLTQSLKEEIRQTATYIIVMSPAYIDSVWCKTERQEFFSILNEKGASTRVFIIEIDEINRKEYPIEINEHVVPYTFWKKDVHSKARLLGFPKKEEDIDYSNKLNDVCYDLARELEKIKKAEAAPVVKATDNGTVFFGGGNR